MTIEDKILEFARKINQIDNEICIELMRIEGIDDETPLWMIPFIMVDNGYKIERTERNGLYDYYITYILMKDEKEIEKRTVVIRFITETKIMC